MTYADRERSWEDGAPIEFYKFVCGDVAWRYNTSDRVLTRLEEGVDEPYLPMPITRSNIQQGAEWNKLLLEISLPREAAVLDLWRPYPPSTAVSVVVHSRHHGETDEALIWIGRVVGPKFGEVTVDLNCEPSITANRREGNLRRSQPGCDLVLFGQGHGQCNLNPEIVPVPGVLTAVAGADVSAEEFASAPRSLVGGVFEWQDAFDVTQQRSIIAHNGEQVTLSSGSGDLIVGLDVIASTRPLYVEATITALSGLTLTAAEFATLPDGRLAGGFVRWVRASDGLVERRTINGHVGNQVTIDYGALDLAVDLELRAYPGCAHNWADCGYHDNRNNYGGDLWMPIKSPFDGDPVW